MFALKDEIRTDLWSCIIDELPQMLLFAHLKIQHLFPSLFTFCYPLKKRKKWKKEKKKRIDIGCNAAPLAEMDEENVKYTLWSVFNIKIILNHNTILWGSACCIRGVCVCPTQIFYKAQTWKWYEHCFSWQNCPLFFFFFPVSIRECLSFGMKCISVHKIIWWYLIQRCAYAVLPLLQEPPFCLSSARRGEKKGRQCAWCQ